MELKDFTGEYLLDAVDFSTEAMDKYGDASEFDDCQVLLFRLNGVVYRALEDPADGYRSCLKDLVVLPSALMKNVFPSVRVEARYCETYDNDTADLVQFLSVATGALVLEVGTCHWDGWYPVFRAIFYPEAVGTI